ncbi:octanoyl-[GcvH]:protein N-octanoyltransferase [Lysinibacillus composti]|uniref:Octanoyl-[GcvH]:protein N-octanoyltransferase n=1 Tax=Lysinibacillus composti TaxID=720633 RepID=A0A3N9UUL5_9BACI|nr:lipoate--protein ligase family protein [Lysinibacillus composti]MBM7608981.1 octanoyl-[GcvH]:protein N-octanoyltransferase [Lysinibacillus composti]RQW75596.1 lipoate--protein ligase family protein [Lysinibacillus composti]
MNQLLTQQTWRFIDQSISAKNRSPLESFAMDDTLCHLVGQQMTSSTIRTWVHDHTVVLGIQDHRLPFVQEGIEYLKSGGYDSIVRNSGGLAVVLDEGVLNVSIVLSEKQNAININSGYDVMVDFIKLLFPSVANQIEAYEIVGSYCPGTYDLSIGGKKFAGISQRRLRDGVAVQIYLCIEGSGSERAQLIKNFYDSSLKGEETKFSYPNIQPEVMASLSELLNEKITVQETVLNLQTLLQNLSSNFHPIQLNEEETELYTFYLKRVLERNEKMLAK